MKAISTMKPTILLTVLAFLLGGCATSTKNIVAIHTDHSTSPITVEQSSEIAMREAKTRDHFPEEPRVRNKRTKFTNATSSRINNGGWRVTVTAMERENRSGDGGAIAYIQEIIPAVVTIDASGKVVRYERATYEQIAEAQKQSRPEGQ
jgi:hypothetical protein